MREHSSETQVLPERPSPLGLELRLPLAGLASIQRGYESQNQEEKWSIYFQRPWVQIWRPSLSGLYCYAVRIEEIGGQCLQVVESWAGYEILNNKHGLGPDLEEHRKVVTWLLDFVAGYSGYQFEHPLVAGTRYRGTVAFRGEATSLDEVEEIADKLRAEVVMMVKDA